MVSGQRPMEIAGMLGGILIFIVAYTIFESSKYGQMLTRRRLVRIVARVGYGIRILVSIVFPLGAAIDIPCGSLAISISNFVFQTTLGPDGDGFGNELLGFVWFCTTTVIQGTLLNIVLLVFLLLLYGIGLLFTAPEDR